MINLVINFLQKKFWPIYYAKKIGVTVGEDCRLINCDYSSEPYLIEIGNHVSATKVRFETHDGGIWIFREKNKEIDVVAPIKIGNNVFIGYGAVILPGVCIGRDSVIGAYSVVTKDVPSGVVFAGVPAKFIKSIDDYKIGALKNCENTKNMSTKEKKLFYTNKYKL
jgi:acetyltransferase-like isoleucine patch superfamily enzyme